GDAPLDPATGTIRSRALLDNGARLFTPGLFARLRLLGAHEHEAVLINDSAVGTDQTVRYVLVVSAGNKAEYRPVQLGPIVDGLRVVESGLASGETIVVNGLQRVRPGAQDRKSTRLNSSHRTISYAVFCLKKKTLKMNMLHC